MGRRGPPPKPTKIKALEGNPGKRPLNENEPQCFEPAPKTPPKWLDEIAKREYKRARTLLDSMGLLTACDKAALEAYCDAYSTMVRAAEVVNQKGFVYSMKTNNGQTYLQQLPHVSIKNQAMELVKKFCQEFGMTPSSRSRLQIKKDAPDEVDPMETLLAGGTPDFKVIEGGKK